MMVTLTKPFDKREYKLESRKPRLNIERRQFSYSFILPERRSGTERRLIKPMPANLTSIRINNQY